MKGKAKPLLLPAICHQARQFAATFSSQLFFRHTKGLKQFYLSLPASFFLISPVSPSVHNQPFPGSRRFGCPQTPLPLADVWKCGEHGDLPHREKQLKVTRCRGRKAQNNSNKSRRCSRNPSLRFMESRTHQVNSLLLPISQPKSESRDQALRSCRQIHASCLGKVQGLLLSHYYFFFGGSLMPRIAGSGNAVLVLAHSERQS